MSQQAINWAWETPVKSYQKLVLVALGDMADSKGQSCPSIQDLAIRCGIAPSTVRKCLKHLAAEKKIYIKQRFDCHGHQITNCYQMRFKNDRSEMTQTMNLNDRKDLLKLALNILQNIENHFTQSTVKNH